MTIVQERKFSMYLTVKDLLALSTYTAAVAALPSFSNFMSGFLTTIQSIQNTRVQQELNSSGLAVNKRALRDDLIIKTMDIVNRIKAFAVVNENNVLESEVSYSKSNLIKSADTILRDKTQLIYNKAIANAAALVPFGVTAAMLVAHQTAITVYLTSIPKPRTSILAGKLITSQLKKLFTTADELLTKMDVIVTTVEISNNALYKHYFDSRKIIHEGTNLIPLRGFVFSATNTSPLSGVMINFSNLGLSTKTTVKGYFAFKRIPGGTHSLLFTKSGFVTQNVVVNVTEGERCEVRVEMIEI